MDNLTEIQKLNNELIETHQKLIEAQALIKGPEGYATWRDAAVHERSLRVAERREGIKDHDVEIGSFKYPSEEDRTKWCVGEWARHYGAFENDKDQVCFGSWFAFANLVIGVVKCFKPKVEQELNH